MMCLLDGMDGSNGYKKLGDPSTGRINLDGGGGTISSGVKNLQNQTVESCQAACECSPYCVGISMEYNETNNYEYTGNCALENWLKSEPGKSTSWPNENIGNVFYYREKGQVGKFG